MPSPSRASSSTSRIRNYLASLFEFGQQRLDFLAATAVGQFAARAGRCLERGFQIAARFGDAVTVGQILAVKEIRVNPVGIDGQRFLEVFLGRSLSPKPIGQPGTLA
jgi:hypothetical protein